MSFYIFHTKCSSIMPHCYRRSSEYLLGIHYPQIIALTIFEYFQMYVRSYSPDKEPHFRQSHIPTFYDVQSYLHYLYHNTILVSCSQTTSVYSQHYLFFNHSLAGRVTRPDLTILIDIYYQNVRGLRTKTLDFKRNIQLCNYHVVVLTETWLWEGIRTEELFSDAYTVWRRDRDYGRLGQKRGGGCSYRSTARTNCARAPGMAFHS